MLTIKDLAVSKDLDRKAMADVAGGMGFPAIIANIASPINVPKFASLVGASASTTGPQMNTTLQSDNDTNIVIGSGQVVNTGGNHNSSSQFADSWATNYVTSAQ